MRNMADMVKVEHLKKNFGDLEVLKDINLTVAEGEKLVIIGPSGSGKSTFIRCINHLEEPTSGTISIAGTPVTKKNRLEMAKKYSSMVFQQFNLYPHLTVLENLTLAPVKLQHVPKDKARETALKCLDRVGLKAKAGNYPAQLSGGQQQRTALARILVGRPKILMLDEPFSALDSYLREEVEGEVGSLLAGFGGTALLVTHNRDEAYRLCRDMIVMDGGQVLRTGGTKEVFADPQSTTAARLTGCKNILSCTRVDAHTVRLTGWDAPLHLAAEVPETCTAVGIRAHDFAPCAPAAPNALPVQLNSTSENPFDWNLIFTAPDGTTRLWWKVSKTNLTAASPEAPAFLGTAPQNIMPLG